jgi:hypothetical protein
MGEEVQWSEVTPDERYRRVALEGLRVIQRTDEYVYRTQGEAGWEEFSKATRPGWAGPVGRKLVETRAHELPADIHGAMRLVGIYCTEVWGNGRRDTTRIETLSETEGRMTIFGGCPMWPLTDDELRGKFPCNKACQLEVDSVVKALGPQFRLETVEGRPLGHQDCVYRVTVTEPHDDQG